MYGKLCHVRGITSDDETSEHIIDAAEVFLVKPATWHYFQPQVSSVFESLEDDPAPRMLQNRPNVCSQQCGPVLWPADGFCELEATCLPKKGGLLNDSRGSELFLCR